MKKKKLLESGRRKRKNGEKIKQSTCAAWLMVGTDYLCCQKKGHGWNYVERLTILVLQMLMHNSNFNTETSPKDPLNGLLLKFYV